ncbi:hypothetical protein EGR_11247 [Echinococcus granulosus]|uniref:Uncharacterized protein n=1 Tax=Echinococcus granulosus TaxID=6210 RepID=W6U0B4_ECHGR|nr:hypothetical protein EGR_11247 [Echinococcus granulosus]EUB53896.1 hypothetical protein EGR_11247 [Echinococcus granulosus]
MTATPRKAAQRNRLANLWLIAVAKVKRDGSHGQLLKVH